MNTTIQDFRFKPFFDKNLTNIIKGVCILMMFFHHFFTFPEWWIEGVNYPFFEQMVPYFRDSTAICVPIFCFLTGYFYFYTRNKNFTYSLRKISDILIPYWSVFFILGSFAFFVIKYPYQPIDIFKESFALNNLPTMFFGWYVLFYMVLMIIFPLFAKVMSKNIYADLFGIIIVLPLLLDLAQKSVSSGSVSLLLIYVKTWVQNALIGYITACYGLFNIIDEFFERNIKSKKCAMALFLILFILLPFGRILKLCSTIHFGEIADLVISFDIVYVTLYIYVLIKLFSNFEMKFIRATLIQFGRYSMLMWFFSCAFFNNSKQFFQPILYYPSNPVLVYVWGLFLCFLPSYCIDILVRKITYYKNRIISFLLPK